MPVILSYRRRIPAFVLRFIIPCVALGMLFTSIALCQDRSILIKAVNGKTGRPIPNEHLLIFVGKSQQDAAHKTRTHEDVTTGADGTAILKFDPNDTGWIQVFADGRTVCFNDPNSQAFNLQKAAQTGESTPNNCGGPPIKNIPGTFIVFAREATLREKMQW